MEEVAKTEVAPKVKAVKKKRGSDRGCLYMLLGTIALTLLVFACGIGSIVYLLFQTPSDTTTVIEEGSSDTVVVLDLNGLITESDNSTLFGPVTDIYVDSVLYQLDEIQNDPNVKAVVLNIESPGGEVVASDVIYQEVMKLREKMPVVAYSGTMAASGGYYIASAADKFLVHPSTLTGSIGVILQTSSMEGLYDKLGIKTKTFKSGQFKDDVELYDEDDEGEIEDIYQSIVDESYDLFLDAISKGRSMDKEELRVLADGRIYTGRQAVENGLADGMGYIDDAIAEAKTLAGVEDATVVEYEDWIWIDSFFGFNLLGGSDAVNSIAPKTFGVYYLPKL